MAALVSRIFWLQWEEVELWRPSLFLLELLHPDGICLITTSGVLLEFMATVWWEGLLSN